MSEFIDLEDVIKTFPLDFQKDIQEFSEAEALKEKTANLKGEAVSEWSERLKKLGAHLFMRMPDGKEVELPIPHATV